MEGKSGHVEDQLNYQMRDSKVMKLLRLQFISFFLLDCNGTKRHHKSLC